MTEKSMKRWFKKYFIPHEENDHRPHLLRSESVFFLALVLAVIEGLFLFQAFIILPQNKFFALIVPNVLVDQTNAQRVLYKEEPLKFNALLQAAAQNKANDMATKGYFAHTSPTGITPWYWIAQTGYRFSYAGENLAVNFVDSSDVTTAWMNSPEHRANILDSNFTDIGIAAAQGLWNGHPATYVVEMFGTPMVAMATASAPIAYVAPSPSAAPTATAATTARPSVSPVPTVAGAEISLATPTPAATKPTKAVTTTKENTTITSSGEQMFVSVKEEETSSLSSSAAATLGGNPAELQDGGLASLIASPLAASNYIFYLAALLTLLALALNVFVKAKVQHARLIMNGLFILLLISGFLLLNHFAAASQIFVM